MKKEAGFRIGVKNKKKPAHRATQSSCGKGQCCPPPDRPLRDTRSMPALASCSGVHVRIPLESRNVLQIVNSLPHQPDIGQSTEAHEVPGMIAVEHNTMQSA